MRVELLNVGWISSAAAIWRQGEDPESRIRFPVPAYLIETDTERILVDTGLNPEAVRDPGSFYGVSLFDFEQELHVGEQVDLATITKVVLTHLHFDHAGGLALLPSSIPIVVQRREWEAGGDETAVARNFFMPRDYASIEPERVVLVDGDHDLLGDGSLELLSTPGHTPGHQSLRLVEQGLVIGADVTHFASTLDDLRFPSFADDFDAQADSARRLRRMRDGGERVLPGHDPDVIVPGPIAL
jgi:glyoxylase-like metal-dependent hydrolase (beta-lactamase superfamily II)